MKFIHQVASVVARQDGDHHHDLYCTCGRQFYSGAAYPHRIQDHIAEENNREQA